MNLSVSNIAWDPEQDADMLRFLKRNNMNGLEIAPTRLFRNAPYEKLKEANAFSVSLKQKYGLTIPSMQSIWFGRTENLFSDAESREALILYTKSAVDFAVSVGCPSLVFGCPKNRRIGDADPAAALDFFRTIGEYAYKNHTVIAIEPNPKIYDTDFLNTTPEVIDFVKAAQCEGLKLNIDFGAMIENNEPISMLSDHIGRISHIHISEPFLAPVKRRDAHYALAEILKKNHYSGFVSLEMKNTGETETVKNALIYLKEVFS